MDNSHILLNLHSFRLFLCELSGLHCSYYTRYDNLRFFIAEVKFYKRERKSRAAADEMFEYEDEEKFVSCKLKIFLCTAYKFLKNVEIRVPAPTGKSGKMGNHFPIREKSRNFEHTGKNTEKLREFLFLVFFGQFLVLFIYF